MGIALVAFRSRQQPCGNSYSLGKRTLQSPCFSTYYIHSYLSLCRLHEAWCSFSKVDTPSKIPISALRPPERKIFLPCFLPYWSIVIRSYTGRPMCSTPYSEYCTGSHEAKSENAWGNERSKNFLCLWNMLISSPQSRRGVYAKKSIIFSSICIYSYIN